jgi:hypothetical protein
VICAEYYHVRHVLNGEVGVFICMYVYILMVAGVHQISSIYLAGWLHVDVFLVVYLTD